MFSIRLKELRECAGYRSQQSFADAFGVAQSTVGGWEAGKREPNYEMTVRLAGHFNVSVDYLMGRTDFPSPVAETLSHISDSLCSDERSSLLILFLRLAAGDPLKDAREWTRPAETVPATFPNRLKRTRVAAHLSQAEAARILKIPFDTYKKFESGVVSPEQKEIAHIAKKLGVSANWLGCTIPYIDPSTNSPFDPGPYKDFVDSAFDPIETTSSAIPDPSEDELISAFRCLTPEWRDNLLQQVNFALKQCIPDSELRPSSSATYKIVARDGGVSDADADTLARLSKEMSVEKNPDL